MFGIQANFRINYPNRVILRVNYIGYIGKGVLKAIWGPILLLYPKPCYNEPCYKEVQVYFSLKFK